MMYDDRASEVMTALEDAEALLEELSNIAVVDDEYGSQVSKVLDDIRYAGSELDDLDTDYHSLVERETYEDEVDNLRDTIYMVTSDVESAISDLRDIVADLEYA